MTLTTLALLVCASASAQSRTDAYTTGDDGSGDVGVLVTSDDGRIDDKTTEKRDPECITLSCVDDLLAPDFDGYVRELEGAIDNMLLNPLTPQLDIGHTVPNSLLDGMPGAPLGDIWTEELGGGMYIEHWFLEDDTMLTHPGDGWSFDHQGLPDWDQMKAILQADPDHLSEVYVEMQVQYVKLPEAYLTATLNYVGPEVERWTFDVMSGNQHAGYMLREVHYDGPQIMARYDHWVFLQGYELLQAGSMDVVANGASPDSTADFYSFAQGLNPMGAAVVEYWPEGVLDTCLLGGPGCGMVFIP